MTASASIQNAGAVKSAGVASAGRAPDHGAARNARLADAIAPDAGGEAGRRAARDGEKRDKTIPSARRPPIRRRTARPAAANAPIQVHIVHSSHMCPRYPWASRAAGRRTIAGRAARGSNGADAAMYGPSRTMNRVMPAATIASSDATVNTERQANAGTNAARRVRRGAQGERADEEAERRSAASDRPSGGDFHAGRIDAGECGAGCKTPKRRIARSTRR